MTDWPDIAAALKLRSAIRVPGAGEYALHYDVLAPPASANTPAGAVQHCLRGALDRSVPVIWTTDTLLGLAATSMAESLTLTVVPESVSDGMQSSAELWVANRGALVSDGSEGPLVVDGLLLMRHSDEPDPFPADNGVLVAGIVKGIPQLVFWWPVGSALGEVVSSLNDPQLALALLAIGHWAGMGLAARACGAIGVVSHATAEGSALVASPSKLPPETVTH